MTKSALRPAENWSEHCGSMFGEAMNQASTGLPEMLMGTCWIYWKEREYAAFSEKSGLTESEAEMRGSNPMSVLIGFPLSKCTVLVGSCVFGS